MAQTREEKLEYKRQWRKQNAEKIKAYEKEYREKHKEHYKELHKNYVETHREEIRAINRKSNAKNKDRVKKYNENYYIKNKDDLIKKANERSRESYCCEDLSMIENYEKAKEDNFQNWDIHHKLETRGFGYTPEELKALDLYYNRPPNELIFLKHKEHLDLHKNFIKGIA